MSARPDPAELRRAKDALREKYGRYDWFRGVGIAPSETGLALRLNVDPSAGVPLNKLPKTFRRYDVEIVFIQGYEPRVSGK